MKSAITLVIEIISTFYVKYLSVEPLLDIYDYTHYSWNIFDDKSFA